MKKRFLYAITFASLLVAHLGMPCFAKDLFKPDFWTVDEFNSSELKNTYGEMPFEFEEALKAPVFSGLDYWNMILGPGSKNTVPVSVIMITEDRPNASAMSQIIVWNPEEKKTHFFLDGIRDIIINNVQDYGYYLDWYKDDDDAPLVTRLAKIDIGKFLGADREGATLGWWCDADTLITTNEQAADYIGTIRHEMGHALGIGCSTEDEKSMAPYITESEFEKFDTETYNYTRFNSNDETSWNYHLYDQTGKQAKNGMLIMTSEMLANWNKENPANTLSENDVFLLDIENLAVFKGEHVTEALAGATFRVNGQDVSGLPVNGWEKNRDPEDDKNINGNAELSHFNTSGMMSHVNYTNYTTFLEVELAAMQDLGYELDRKNFYGFSVYGNNGTIVNQNGYSARNEDGTAYLPGVFNTTPLGTGLHIYGDGNNVMQVGDILTSGNGSIGVRIDGTENTVTIADGTQVHSDGFRGIGTLIAYGKNQTLNVNGEVTANGESGNAIQIDFGSSSNGTSDEYRGSYIRYTRMHNDEDGIINKAQNKDLVNSDGTAIDRITGYIDGAMVKALNINGKVSGKENAIYISKNAFVQDINIGQGAAISGNITNNWKHFSESDDANNYCYNFDYEEDDNGGVKFDTVGIQYNGKTYHYGEYIPDLVTNINFKSDQFYSGDITGRDNTKINVTGGTLAFTGNADVVNVKVSEGATLLGGNYKLNAQTTNSDFAEDTETGVMINRGTIGSYNRGGTAISGQSLARSVSENVGATASTIANMTIEGNLDTTNGTLLFTANGAEQGTIGVTGDVMGLDSAKIAVDPKGYYITGSGIYNANFLSQNGKNISLDSAWRTSNYFVRAKPLMSARYFGGSLGFVITNNLGTSTSRQSDAVIAMRNMSESFGADMGKRAEIGVLTNIDSVEDAKSALDDISGQDLAALYGAVQREGYAEKLLRKHFDTTPKSASDDNWKHGVWFEIDPLFRKEDIEIESKNFGLYAAVGYDHSLSEALTVGGFFAGGWNKYESGSAKNNACDLRLGADIAWREESGVHSAFAYFDYGLQVNKTEREIEVLNLSGDSKNTTHLLELGGEYRFDIMTAVTKGESNWNISPYAKARISILFQPSFDENGLGIYNMQNETTSNFYANLGAGLAGGYKTGRFGVLATAGVQFVPTKNAKTEFHYEGDSSHTYSNECEHAAVLAETGLSGYGNIANGWALKGSFNAEFGKDEWQIGGKICAEKCW